MSLKPISAEEVTRRATAPLVVGETIDLSERLVMEPLVLAGARLANVDFSGSHFKAHVTCVDTKFAGLAWFRRCHFDQGVRFERALFENDCRLDYATSGGAIQIEQCELRGVASFDRCHIQGDLAVRSSIILGNTSLSGIRIEGRLDLQASELLGGLWLDHAALVGGLVGDRAEVHGRLWLREATPGTGRDLTCFGYTYV
jgi:hypothetical protein